MGVPQPPTGADESSLMSKELHSREGERKQRKHLDRPGPSHFLAQGLHLQCPQHQQRRGASVEDLDRDWRDRGGEFREIREKKKPTNKISKCMSLKKCREQSPQSRYEITPSEMEKN